MSKRLLIAAAVAAAAVVAAGCGGSSDSSSSDTTPTTEWADGLCTAITTWTDSLKEIVPTVTGGNLSKNSLTAAVDDAKSATETFTTSLGDLGKPDTEAGQQAKVAVDQLATDVKADMAKIEDAVAGASGAAGLLAAVPVISSTLKTAGDQVSSTVSTVQGLDAKGELQSAFKDATSCQSVTAGS